LECRICTGGAAIGRFWLGRAGTAMGRVGKVTRSSVRTDLRPIALFRLAVARWSG